MEGGTVVLVTGAAGMVGHNIVDVVCALQKLEPLRLTKSEVYGNMLDRQDNESLENFVQLHVQQAKFVFVGREECNLLSYDETLAFFRKVQPTHVIHPAAKVGGLFANMNEKVKFLEENIMINMNVVRSAY